MTVRELKHLLQNSNPDDDIFIDTQQGVIDLEFCIETRYLISGEDERVFANYKAKSAYYKFNDVDYHAQFDGSKHVCVLLTDQVQLLTPDGTDKSVVAVATPGEGLPVEPAQLPQEPPVDTEQWNELLTHTIDIDGQSAEYAWNSVLEQWQLVEAKPKMVLGNGDKAEAEPTPEPTPETETVSMEW